MFNPIDEKKPTYRSHIVVTTEMYEIFHAVLNLGNLHTNNRKFAHIDNVYSWSLSSKMYK